MTLEDITRSYATARRGAAWIDRSTEGVIEVGGRDRISWLQGLLTNDVASLRAGRGCYAAYLTPQGRMITDARVLVHEDRCWIDLPGPVTAAVLSRLDLFVIAEDVALRDLSGRLARVAVHGPRSAAVVARALAPGSPATGDALSALAEHHHLALATAVGDVVAAGGRDLGGPGFDLYADASALEALVAAIEDAGAGPMDEDTWHVCRVEAARPAFGIDMDDQTIPLEAGIEDRAISFTKGCYVGQEVVVRVRDRGQGRVAKRLMSVAAAAEGREEGLDRGDRLFAGDRDAGRITSAAFSPALGRSIGLAYVAREDAVAGGSLTARHGDREVPVTLATGPLVDVRALSESGGPWTRT